MLICPYCSAELENLDMACKSCRFIPQTIDGFVAWSPDLMNQELGFPAQSFPVLARIEAEHFWFRARNALILWALKKYFPGFKSLFEVGCGTSFVLSGIAQAFPGARLVGVELFTAGLEFAARRVQGAELLQADARRLPFVDEFEIVSAFDVIEHVKEDDVVLRNLYRAVTPGGGCLITVPQHRWLWSTVDEYACHIRRYTMRDLHEKVTQAGFTILRSTSFVTSLLPFMWISRLSQQAKLENFNPHAELQINPILNRIFEWFLQLELWLIRMGISFPFGGSRLIVAAKLERNG
jgi:SAM-dependent methyltransferase